MRARKRARERGRERGGEREREREREGERSCVCVRESQMDRERDSVILAESCIAQMLMWPSQSSPGLPSKLTQPQAGRNCARVPTPRPLAHECRCLKWSAHILTYTHAKTDTNLINQTRRVEHSSLVTCKLSSRPHRLSWSLLSSLESVDSSSHRQSSHSCSFFSISPDGQQVAENEPRLIRQIGCLQRCLLCTLSLSPCVVHVYFVGIEESQG